MKLTKRLTAGELFKGLLVEAWDNGSISMHDTKTQKELEVDQEKFFDDYEDQIKMVFSQISKEQREICAKNAKIEIMGDDLSHWIDSDSILNAPEPENIQR